MRVTGRVVVITGGARGIGAALAHRFDVEGAAAVIVTDRSAVAAAMVADGLSVTAEGLAVDVTDEQQIADLVRDVEQRYGRIDLFCSNAGVTTGGGVEAPDADWKRSWSVNVLSHVYAARAVLPGMLARGDGYLLQTCSAAGVLTAVGDAAYTATKHAAVGLAEWLSVTYGDQGIKVSALCPQGVNTPLLTDGLTAGHLGARVVAASGPLLEPDEVAEVVVQGLADERFMILPHPEVSKYAQHKAADPDRWLGAMRAMAKNL